MITKTKSSTLTVEQFDARVQHINEQAEEMQARVDAYKDQEFAKLFIESGWTQQQLADHIGQSLSYVSYRLRFGRFLKFSTIVEKARLPKNLTEGKFRSYWERTGDEGKEAVRFRKVYDLMADDLIVCQDSVQVGKLLHEKCSDWRYRSAAEMASLLGVDAERVVNAINRLSDCRVQKRKAGTGDGVEVQYRLKKVKRIKTKIKVDALVDELLEICLEGLRLTKESNQIEYSRVEAASRFDRIKKRLEELFAD